MQTDTQTEVNLKRLEQAISILDNNPTKEELVMAIEIIVKIVEKIDKRSIDSVDLIEKTYSRLLAVLAEKYNVNSSEFLNTIDFRVKNQLAAIDEKMARIKEGSNGKDGKDGKDADETKIVSDVLSLMPKPKEIELDSPEQIRDKLQSLEDDDRLDASAIKNLDERLKRLESRPTIGSAARSNNSTKFKDLSSQTNGTLKVFSVPKNVASILFTSDFPFVLFENNGFTINGARTQITLTTDNAPSPGSQLIYQYSSYFN